MARVSRPAPDPLHQRLLGFRLVRTVLGLIAWLAPIALGIALLDHQKGSISGIPFWVLTLIVGYVTGSVLSLGLWNWYRGWWHLPDGTLRELIRLSPAEFERAVADLFRSLGYKNVEVTGSAGDGGVDVRFWDDQGRFVIVQCKNYALGHNVGSPEVTHLLGAIQAKRAYRGVMVTTSDFTRPARALAKAEGIELINGRDLGPLFRATCIVPIPDRSPLATLLR